MLQSRIGFRELISQWVNSFFLYLSRKRAFLCINKIEKRKRKLKISEMHTKNVLEAFFYNFFLCCNRKSTIQEIYFVIKYDPSI